MPPTQMEVVLINDGIQGVGSDTFFIQATNNNYTTIPQLPQT